MVVFYVPVLRKLAMTSKTRGQVYIQQLINLITTTTWYSPGIKLFEIKLLTDQPE